jgi:hypothetical protein
VVGAGLAALALLFKPGEIAADALGSVVKKLFEAKPEDYKGPQGDAGAKGATGPKGDRGTDGDDGNDGNDVLTTRYRCGEATVTTRDRGVDVVGIRDGHLVLAQVKWYREGSCVSGDADMKLALIGATAQRGCGLADPPRTVLVVRRGARTARSSPGTEMIEYVELTDADLGLEVHCGLGSYKAPGVAVGLSGIHGADAYGSLISPGAEWECTTTDACPFEAYRYKKNGKVKGSGCASPKAKGQENNGEAHVTASIVSMLLTS